MKRSIVSGTFVLLAAFLSSPLAAQKDVASEIAKANERFMTMFAEGDATAFVAGNYTADARLLPPNSPVVTGTDGLAAFWGGMMEAGITPKLQTESALAYGKIAVEEGTVGIYAGDQKVDDVKYIVIWKKHKGEWLMHQDIWNSSMPPAN